VSVIMGIDQWPKLDELRRAAKASKIGSWNHALSGVRAGARTKLLAVIPAARARVLGPPQMTGVEVASVAPILFGMVRQDSLVAARDGRFEVLG
jgi:hypothetical protein